MAFMVKGSMGTVMVALEGIPECGTAAEFDIHIVDLESARTNTTNSFVVGTRGLPKFRNTLSSVAGGFSNHAHNPVLGTR